MTRLIDADALSEALMTRWNTADKNAEKIISSVMADIVTPIVVGTPTIDAVEVVRCKECRKRKYCEGIYYDFNEMNYCAHGERETK